MFGEHVNKSIHNIDFVKPFPNGKTVRFKIHALFHICSKKRTIEVTNQKQIS